MLFFHLSRSTKMQGLLSILLMLLLNSLFIIGLHNAARFEFHPLGIKDCQGADQYGVMNDSKMLLWKLRYTAEKKLGLFYSKPLFSCPPCMASIWGTVFYFSYIGFSITSILMLPSYIFALSGLTLFIHSKIN